MSQEKLPSLNQQIVQGAAEQLMTSNGQTTTLEVKKHLRSKGYWVVQSDISNLMHAAYLSNRNDWTYVQERYRIYFFKADSNLSLNTYLQKGVQYWTIDAKGKAFTTEEGKGNELVGNFQESSFSSNREMMQAAYALVEKQKKQGFVETNDKRLPLKLRQKVAPYYGQKMLGCSMGFFEAEKLVQQAAIFEVNGQSLEGYLLLNKSAGYTFRWEFPKGLAVVREILEVKKWDATKMEFQEAKLLGEKVKGAEAFDTNGKGIALEDGSYKLLEKQNITETKAILVNNANLYQIECIFEGGNRVVLSKFQWDLEEEILPLVKHWLIK